MLIILVSTTIVYFEHTILINYQNWSVLLFPRKYLSFRKESQHFSEVHVLNVSFSTENHILLHRMSTKTIIVFTFNQHNYL